MNSLIEMSDEHKKNKESYASLLDEATEDEWFIKCMDYVVLRETKTNLSQADIAAYFDVAVNTLKSWQIKWTKSGLLQKCRRIISISAVEEVRNAEYSILRSWPSILERQRTTAVEGKSDHNALEAARFLYEAIVQPAMTAAGEAGIDEIEYVKSIQDKEVKFDPFALQKVLDTDLTDTSQ